MNIDNFDHVSDAQLEILQAMDIDGAELRHVGDGYRLADKTSDLEVGTHDVAALIAAGLVDPNILALTVRYYLLADEDDSE